MIMGADITCPKCEVEKPVFWAERQHIYMCAACHRIHNPPFMTLVKFSQGSYNRLWNVEVGAYEEFNRVSAIELCDWYLRSKQATVHSLVPRVTSVVYHLEFHGSVKCGRCVDYPYFESEQYCLSQACEGLAKPHRPPKDREYPNERSRFVKWTKRNHL